MTNPPAEKPGWRDAVLNQLIPELADCFIVEDADHLMTEPGIQEVLTARDFEFYPFDNSIALRYFYELKVRRNSNDRLAKPFVISLDAHDANVRDLPFDIVKQATVVSLSLTDCFPQLYHAVLRCLAAEELDALEQAVAEYVPGKLGDTGSRDFVLRHIYQVAPEIVQTPADLLRNLLRIHDRDIVVPDLLKGRMVEVLSRKQQFHHWPLKDIVCSREWFFSFLQDHWSSYVDAIGTSLAKGPKEGILDGYQKPATLPGTILPLDHDDVRIYIANLFVEGLLTPIEVDKPEQLSGHWCLVGVKHDPDAQQRKRLAGLLARCHDTLPTENSGHHAWLQFAPRWAELCAIYHTNKGSVDETSFVELRNLIDNRFKAWMLSKYNGLHNHSPMPPVMLHHIPRNMAREIESSPTSKSALIVIDGLALDQWVTLRDNMAISQTMTEASVFAWVPTVTSVSRQALFSAKVPYQFAKSIHTTSAEPKAWQRHWSNYGLSSSEVFYEKSLGTDDEVAELIDRLADYRLRAVGLVINTVDDIMHGMLLGSAGMHNQVRQWAGRGYLAKLIDALANLGFTVHITSDHGNVEALGCGKINEGAVAESRGERTRIYKTETLREEIEKKVKNSTENALVWPPVGLPADYWPIVMSGREAFAAKSERIVGHGGIAIEEVIVPYIVIHRE